VEIDRGWRAVQAVPSDKDEKDEEQLPEQTLARHKKGETLEVKSGKASKHKTKAPARYTEATLLTAMENCGKLVEDKKLRESIKGSGLGTPATRAEIIEKLIRTSYIERQRKELVPTSKGIQLMDLAPPDLRSPELTAQWEQRLAEIARGQGKRPDFMADIRRDTVQLVQSIKSDSSTYRADNVSKSKCPQCGRFMLLVNGRKGKILACPERSCGYRQPEAEDFSGKGGNSRANRRLMAKYSNQEELETNLGELLKAALAKKEQG